MTFEEINEQMGQLLATLEVSPAYSEKTLPDLRVNSGAYVFYEGGKPMYVGIVGPHSVKGIRDRIRQHMGWAPPSAPLASLMTKEALPGNITTARVAADHLDLFKQQQARVGNMEVQAVAIEDCVVLAAFEIYAAVQLQTPYNFFCTH